MKKFIIVPLIAATALGLAACKPSTPAVDNSVSNEVTLNSEEPILDANAAVIDENATTVDNAGALDAVANVSNSN
jgi:hypothetical protein